MIYRTTRFSMTLNEPYPQFQGHAFFDAEYLINGTTYRHRFNEIVIGTNTRPTQQCHFEWPWVTLSHLANYSMTRSVARSLCDSWASCYYTFYKKKSVNLYRNGRIRNTKYYFCKAPVSNAEHVSTSRKLSFAENVYLVKILTNNCKSLFTNNMVDDKKQRKITK